MRRPWALITTGTFAEDTGSFMSATRNGKIARLPKFIRDELGQRFSDGEQGKQLVEWLNGEECVQEVLKEQFRGRTITEQNLSKWKQGGYQDWLRDEERKLFVSKLTEQSGDLDEAADGQEISDRFAGVLAAEMTRLAVELLEKETDPEKRWQRLCKIHRELSQLRRDDHRAIRTLIKRETWERQKEREAEEADKQFDKETDERRCAPYWAMLELKSTANLFGGGEWGRHVAELILETQYNLKPGRLSRKVDKKEAESKPSSPNPTESDSIQPNQTKFSTETGSS